MVKTLKNIQAKKQNREVYNSCTICQPPVPFYTKEAYYAHLRRSHTLEEKKSLLQANKKEICQYCNEKYKSQASLYHHLKTCKQKDKQKAPAAKPSATLNITKRIHKNKTLSLKKIKKKKADLKKVKNLKNKVVVPKKIQSPEKLIAKNKSPAKDSSPEVSHHSISESSEEKIVTNVKKFQEKQQKALKKPSSKNKKCAQKYQSKSAKKIKKLNRKLDKEFDEEEKDEIIRTPSSIDAGLDDDFQFQDHYQENLFENQIPPETIEEKVQTPEKEFELIKVQAADSKFFKKISPPPKQNSPPVEQIVQTNLLTQTEESVLSQSLQRNPENILKPIPIRAIPQIPNQNLQTIQNIVFQPPAQQNLDINLLKQIIGSGKIIQSITQSSNSIQNSTSQLIVPPKNIIPQNIITDSKILGSKNNSEDILKTNQAVRNLAGNRIEEIDEQAEILELFKIFEEMFQELYKIFNLYGTVRHQKQLKDGADADLQNLSKAQQKKLKPQHQKIQQTRQLFQTYTNDEVSKNNVSISYAEITKPALTKILDLMRTIPSHTGEIVYCDVGSGFGAAVLQMAIETGMKCVGLEILENRYMLSVETLLKFKEKFLQNQNLKALKVLDSINFSLIDIGKLKSFQIEDKQVYITHIYAHDKCFHPDSRQFLINAINNSPWVQVLSWNQTPNKTFEKYGLRNFILSWDLDSLANKGGKNHFKFYIYTRQPSKIPRPKDKSEETFDKVQENLQSKQISNQKSKSKEIKSKSKEIIEEEQKIPVSNQFVQGYEDSNPDSQNKQCADNEMENFDGIQKLFQIQEGLKSNPIEISSSSATYEKQDFKVPEKKVPRKQIQVELNFQTIEENISDLTLRNLLNEEVSKSIFKAMKKSPSLQQATLEKFEELDSNELKSNFEAFLKSKKLNFSEIKKQDSDLAKNLQESANKFFNSANKRHYFEKVCKNTFQKFLSQERKIQSFKEEVKDLENMLASFFERSLKKNGFYDFKVISSGAFSQVLKCKSKKFNHGGDALEYAIKVPNCQGVKLIQQEIIVLKRLQESREPSKDLFIVKFIQEINLKKLPIMLMEYYPQHLSDVIYNEELNDLQIKFISYGILRAVSIAHDLNIFHFDIKPENILMNEKFIPKLCDWNLSTNQNGGGTTTYQAPELFIPSMKHFKYQNRIDSWALGLTLYRLAHGGNFPLDIDELKNNIEKGKYFEFPKEITEAQDGIMEIIKKLLIYQPAQRATPAQVLKSNYFEGVPNKIRKDLNIKEL